MYVTFAVHFKLGKLKKKLIELKSLQFKPDYRAKIAFYIVMFIKINTVTILPRDKIKT